MDDGVSRLETTHRIYSTTDRLDELPEDTKLRTLCVWLAAQVPAESLRETVGYLTTAVEHYQLAQVINEYEVQETRHTGGNIRTEKSVFFGYPED